jgi:hypothetical protein
VSAVLEINIKKIGGKQSLLNQGILNMGEDGSFFLMQSPWGLSLAHAWALSGFDSLPKPDFSHKFV